MRERQKLDKAVASVRLYEGELDELIAMIDLAIEEEDESFESENTSRLERLAQEVERQRYGALLAGEADGNDCYLDIQAGAGGTESQDWALMLQRMYLRWSERRDFKAEIIEEQSGIEAGIKSCSILIKGDDAYGWLKVENGVHRLVRISPFDSSARRHTSFASISTYPAIDEAVTVEINVADVRVDTMRASGAGGQHVNKTDSAVRLTHIPTGIVVVCQKERSQHKNRATAWARLRAKLYERELQLREAQAQERAPEKTDIGWGNQIRSYVLQPYQLVKDLRTGTQSASPDTVLDGALDPFLQSALAHRIGENDA